MTVYEYCDLKFQNLSFDMQKQFSIKKEGETKALLLILNLQRTFWKFASIPKFLLLYVLTNVGFLQAPKSRINELRPQPKVDNQAEKPDAKVLSH